MEYQKHYNLLIERGRIRLIEGYTEKHHIIPRCMNGTDDIDNLVALTPEEHYVAHQLLVKIYPDEPKLVFAAKAMTMGTKRNNKLYDWLKRRLNKTKISEETKKKMSDAAKVRIHSEETKKKISKALKGKSKSIEHKKKMKKLKSDEHKKKISEFRKGMKFSNEHRKNLSKVRKGVLCGKYNKNKERMN